MNGSPPRGSIPHPRRPPAHKSVSLRHRPPGPYSNPTHHSPQSTATPSHFTASDQANPPSSVSPKIAAKQSSGESSDAGKWFESTNNTAAQREESFVDNEPPFFLRNSSSSGTPPEQQHTQSGLRGHHRVAMPLRPGLTHFASETSSVEDFRSVIDDLTVANKRLKQKLRKYERLYDAPHLQDDKLFEVRFHGLPDHKKKELEETLRKFAADLDASPADSEDPPTTTFVPTLDHRGASSLTSRFAESGYASNSISASGQHSTLATGGQYSNARKSKATFDRQQQNVQSYLHDIPAGLLPKHSAPMTDKSKKKLVVRRLEQIFAGKQSAPGNHPHPMQQEEVAQLAAVADRQEREASGAAQRREGLREARIMQGAGVGVGDEHGDSLQQSRPAGLNDQTNSGSGSPDQRPTRPLDLDPFRAQVPAENMEYIRHLGFTPPDMVTGESPEDGHGWIYLNLLINMAQLHTINVTPDFVQDAVKDYSSKLELSLDGRKIRWKGGYDVTRTSSDSSSEHLDGMSPGKNGKSPKKHLPTGNSDSTDSIVDPERQARRIARATRAADQQKFAYTPMFYHKEDSDEDDLNELASSSNSPAHPPLPKDPSSGMGSSTMRSSSSRKRRDDGPMIFYKAKFCTDLSGDQGVARAPDHSSYSSLPTQPLGALPTTPSDDSSSVMESKGPLKSRPMQLEEKDESQLSSEDSLGFSPEALRNDTSDESPEAMEFEASGLGGVRPEDNFSIRVRREQVQSDRAATARLNQKSRHYPKHILDALEGGDGRQDGGGSRPVISERIVSASHRHLPNSELPPASFLPFDSTSSGDVDSDLESDVSSSPSISESIEDNLAAMSSLRNLSPTDVAHHPPARVNSLDVEDEDDDSYLVDAPPSDELEYDPTYADKLAAEIPAGSSAATAGGGSGFNSPNAMMKDASSTSGGSASKSPKLKRTRTSDNMSGILPGKTPKLE